MIAWLLLLVTLVFVSPANADNACGSRHLLPAAGVTSQQPVYAESYLDTMRRSNPSALDQEKFETANCGGIYQAPVPGERVWLKFTVVNTQARTYTGYIDFGETVFDEVVLFERLLTGSYSEKKNGRIVARSERAAQTLKTKIPFTLEPNAEAVLYLRITGTAAPTLTPYLLTEDLYFTASSAEQFLSSIFIGFLLALLIISLILFRRADVRHYQFYVFYLLSILIGEIIWAGWLNLLTDTQIAVSGMNRIIEALYGIGALALIVFTGTVLDVKRQPKILRQAIYTLFGVTAVGTIFSVIDPWVFSAALQFIYLAGILVLFSCSLYRYRDGLPQAKPLCISFLIFFLGIGLSTWFYLSPPEIDGATSVIGLLIKRPQDWSYYIGVLGQSGFMAIAIIIKLRTSHLAEIARSVEAPTLELAQVREEFSAQLQHSEKRIAALEQSLVDHYPDADLSPADTRFVGWAREQISIHMEDLQFGVKELASALGTSEKTLGRRLKRTVNQSPVTFIRTQRLTHARDLFLINQHNTVAEVAYASGFSNLSHFARHYRETFGVSPKDALRAGPGEPN